MADRSQPPCGCAETSKGRAAATEPSNASPIAARTTIFMPTPSLHPRPMRRASGGHSAIIGPRRRHGTRTDPPRQALEDKPAGAGLLSQGPEAPIAGA